MNYEPNRSINCIGIHLGQSSYCLSVSVGCPIYIHGTTDQAREFAREIIEAANRHDETCTTTPGPNWADSTEEPNSGYKGEEFF